MGKEQKWASTIRWINQSVSNFIHTAFTHGAFPGFPHLARVAESFILGNLPTWFGGGGGESIIKLCSRVIVRNSPCAVRAFISTHSVWTTKTNPTYTYIYTVYVSSLSQLMMHSKKPTRQALHPSAPATLLYLPFPNSSCPEVLAATNLNHQREYLSVSPCARKAQSFYFRAWSREPNKIYSKFVSWNKSTMAYLGITWKGEHFSELFSATEGVHQCLWKS